MKKILALLLAVVMVLGLAACAPADPANTDDTGSTNGSEGTKGTEGTSGTTEAEEITLSVWGPQEDQVDGKGWLNEMLAKFEEAHPEYKITWEVGVCGEGDAGNNVKADPEAAGDVYMYANDQMGTLLEANALSKLGGSYKEQVLADNTQILIDTVTYSDGEIYGFPMTNNTWFLYYNKETYTEEDVKSLETMLEKGVVSYPVTTAWNGGAFFMSNGGTLFGENGVDAAAGIQFGGDAGYAAALKMVQLAANKDHFVDDASGLGVTGLKEGTVDACFTGSWNYADLKAALGDNLGIAVLPTVEIGGETVQMKAFAGSKCVGVNPNADHPKAAMQLAAFLASEEAQLARFEMREIIPAHKALAESEAVKNSPVAVIEIETMNLCGVIQPVIPEMAAYWTPMGTFGAAVMNGEVTEENYKEQVDLFVDQLNGTGL